MTLWCGGGFFKGSSKGSFKGSFKGFFKGSFLGFSGSDVKVNPISNPILIRFHLNHFDSVVYFLLNDSSGIWFRLRRSSPTPSEFWRDRFRMLPDASNDYNPSIHSEAIRNRNHPETASAHPHRKYFLPSLLLLLHPSIHSSIHRITIPASSVN